MGEKGRSPAQIVGSSRKPEARVGGLECNRWPGGWRGASREMLRGSLCLPVGVVLGGT